MGHRTFSLVEGHSTIDPERVLTSSDPFACTWVWHEDHTPEVRLVANRRYSDRRRGPRVEEVRFRNDLTTAEALESICTTDACRSPTAARQALNLAVDRERLVRDVLAGHGTALAGLTPATAFTAAQRAPDRLRPHPHDPARAR